MNIVKSSKDIFIKQTRSDDSEKSEYTAIYEVDDTPCGTLITPKPENGVRLQATLGSQNPMGLPVEQSVLNGSLLLKMIYKKKLKETVDKLI